MTELQKILAGVAIAITAVIYNTLNNDDIGNIELITGVIAIAIVLIVGFWLSRSAKKRDELNNANDIFVTEQAQRENEIQIPQNYSLAQFLADHSNPSSLPIEVDQVQKAYHKLIDLIVYTEDKSKFHEAVDSIRFLEDDNPQSYFFQLNELFLEISHLFFINLDWKQGADDLHIFTQKILDKTPFKPVFQPLNKYPSDASILYGLKPGENLSQVFEDYIIALNEVDLSIAFLDTEADYFVIFIYRLKDEQTIKKSVSDAGVFFGSPR